MTDLLNDIYTDGCKAKKYRLSDFFNRWWDEYAQHPAEYITPEQYKAVNAIRVCRTTALGIEYGKSVIAARTVSARHAAGVTR